MKISEKLKETAFHEAGHTLAYLLVNKKFIYVTIKSNGDALGHVQRRRKVITKADYNKIGDKIIPKTIIDPDRFGYFFEEDFILCAGGIAEAIYISIRGVKDKKITSQNIIGGSAHDILGLVHPEFTKLPDSFFEKYFTFLNEYTGTILLEEKNLSKLRIIAKALIKKKTLKYNDVIKIIQQ